MRRRLARNPGSRRSPSTIGPPGLQSDAAAHQLHGALPTTTQTNPQGGRLSRFPQTSPAASPYAVQGRTTIGADPCFAPCCDPR